MASKFVNFFPSIADIHEHFNLDPMEMANGIIKDFRSGKSYISRSQLNSMELMHIGNAIYLPVPK